MSSDPNLDRLIYAPDLFLLLNVHDPEIPCFCAILDKSRIALKSILNKLDSVINLFFRHNGARKKGTMSNDLPTNLQKRIEELWGKEQSYWDDEFYSMEAMTNLDYRSELERVFKLDPLGPLPPRQTDTLP
jgi:hypothetical protein